MLAHIIMKGFTKDGIELPTATYYPVLTNDIPQLIVAYRTHYTDCVRVHIDCAI